MIGFIIGLFVGGAVMTIVISCFAANGVMYWRRRSERLEWLVAQAVKHIPCKVWREITPALQDEMMRITEKSYMKKVNENEEVWIAIDPALKEEK